jgi:GMP synthase-like glutamine amidotransferase
MNKPVIGICFGSQLLAKLLGADVRKNTVMEIGVYQVRLTDAGRKSHLFRNIHASFPVFHWHRDTFDLPRRGRLLVEGDDCRNQAFSYIRVVGLQFHLEVTPKDSAEWINKYHQELINVNKSKSRIINECKAAEEEMKKFAYRLMENFL